MIIFRLGIAANRQLALFGLESTQLQLAYPFGHETESAMNSLAAGLSKALGVDVGEDLRHEPDDVRGAQSFDNLTHT